MVQLIAANHHNQQPLEKKSGSPYKAGFKWLKLSLGRAHDLQNPGKGE